MAQCAADLINPLEAQCGIERNRFRFGVHDDTDTTYLFSHFQGEYQHGAQQQSTDTMTLIPIVHCQSGDTQNRQWIGGQPLLLTSIAAFLASCYRCISASMLVRWNKCRRIVEQSLPLSRVRARDALRMSTGYSITSHPYGAQLQPGLTLVQGEVVGMGYRIYRLHRLYGDMPMVGRAGTPSRPAQIGLFSWLS